MTSSPVAIGARDPSRGRPIPLRFRGRGPWRGVCSLPRVKIAATTLCALVLAVLGGCSAPATHHDDEPVETSSEALSASDPVSAAVGQSCSTTSVKGLAQQLVDEIQCMRPGTLARIDTTPGLSLGPAVFPWMQAPAASALASARSARGKTMAINSALRTLPQQYLLYRWYQTGRCGIGLAARPGTSNHESALAVDVQDDAGWRSAMSSKGFRWLGASDPVHFDYTGAGVVDLRGLSVKAFQRLWNRNHPTDTIAEDGDYGPATEARLAKAPVGGFAQGASSVPANHVYRTDPDHVPVPKGSKVILYVSKGPSGTNDACKGIHPPKWCLVRITDILVPTLMPSFTVPVGPGH